MTKQSKTLKRKFAYALLALLIAFASIGTATFAWYIYNTNAHTTSLHMAAGSYSSLLISDSYDGEYKYSVSLASVVGELIPVSTNRIQNGFQEVKEGKAGTEGQPDWIAYLFKPAEKSDYYLRSLYLRASGDSMDVYIKNIGYTDSSTAGPISTAIRIGLVVYKPGDPNTVDNEYIIAINPDQHIANPVYNTEKGSEGHVLDSTKTDGSTVKFDPLTPANYCKVDESTGAVEVTSSSTKLCTCPANDGDGSPVRVDMYVWLEGCDQDCYGTLGTLSDASIEFAGVISSN